MIAPTNTTVGNSWNEHGDGHGHPDGRCAYRVGRLHLVHGDRAFDALYRRDPGRHRHDADVGRRRLDVQLAGGGRPDSDESRHLLLQRRLYSDTRWQVLVGVATERQRVFHGLPRPSRHADTRHDGDRPDEHHGGELVERHGDGHGQPRRAVRLPGRSPSPCARRPSLRRRAAGGSRSAPSRRRRRSATSRRSACPPVTPRPRRAPAPTATTPSYTATPGGRYSSVWQQSDSECFTVCPGQAGHADTRHDGDRPNEHDCGELVERHGDGHGQRRRGAPTGSVAFTLCEETAPSTPCSGGTPVGTVTRRRGSATSRPSACPPGTPRPRRAPAPTATTPLHRDTRWQVLLGVATK